MPDPDREFEDFKSRIDLREYAARLGYELDRRESSRNSSVMRAGPDKIVIRRDTDSHYVYFSVRDEADNGSIIDFASRRKRLNFGQVRKELRPWIGVKSSSLPLFAPLLPSAADRGGVERDYSRMRLAGRHLWLEEKRGIPPALLSSSRFVGRVRIDERGNAVFPHFDAGGLCGFEKKNEGFTGFASGGVKGLWESHDHDGDTCLVLAESAIDGLSYAALFPNPAARYRSIGGEVNPVQPALIRAAVLDLPAGSTVIAAMDADEGGRKLAAMVELAVTNADRADIIFRLHLPPKEGTDWNDALRAAPAYHLPTGPIAPAPNV